MAVSGTVLFTILLTAVVTFVPRVLGLTILSRITLPPLMRSWLQYIPITVMTALIAAELFVGEGTAWLVFRTNEVIGFVVTFLIAYRYQTLLGAVVGGMATVALLRLILG
ncbi:MAG: AzlD domain-containing protein [Bacilli bacterium]